MSKSTRCLKSIERYTLQTILPISTKRTIIAHLNSLTNKNTSTHDVGNPGHAFKRTQKWSLITFVDSVELVVVTMHDISTWHINMTYQHDISTWHINMTYQHDISTWHINPYIDLVWFGFMVFISTFNNILAISWRSVLLVEEPAKTTDMSQVTDQIFHIMLYTSPWSRFKLTTSVVLGSCTSNYHMKPPASPHFFVNVF